MERLHKPPSDLATLPLIAGKKVLNDTIELTSCNLAFRRSIGFDSLQRLSVVGLTHASEVSSLENDRDCTREWLSAQFGPVTADSSDDDSQILIWQLDGKRITLEAKQYTQQEGFVMVYYY